MSVLDRKLRRELIAAKGVLAAIVGIITVGILSFVSMCSLYFNLDESRRSYYVECRMADFWVNVKKIPLSELDRVATVAGVSDYRSRISFEATVDLEGVAQPLSGRVLSLPEEPAPIINNIVLRRGGYFTDRRREEVIVNDAFARARNIKPGDRLHLLLNNRRQELFVVGTAMSSEFVYLLAPGGLIPDPANYGVFYIKRRFAEEVFDFEGACNEIVGVLAPNAQQQSRLILKQLESRLEPFGVATTTPLDQQPSHWFLTSEIEGLKLNATILPTVFLAVAALVLNMLMLRMAEQQRGIVGTLKAFGYRDPEIFWHFLKFGVTVGIVGGILGAILGYVLAGGMVTLYEEFYEFPRLFNRPYPLVMLAGGGISVAFAAIGALRGVRSVVKLRPAEAMRPKAPPIGRRVLLERFQSFWQSLDFRWQMVLRAVFRNRTRTLAGLFASMIGAALLQVTFFMYDSMNQLTSFQFDKLLLSDFELALKTEKDWGAWREAKQLPGVDHVEPVLNVGCTLYHNHLQKRIAITGLVPNARLTVPRDVEGRAVPVPESGLLLTRKLADILAVAPGDAVTMIPTAGRKTPRQIKVIRVVDSYLGLAAYADFSFLNRLIGESDAITNLQLKVTSGPGLTEQFYRELKTIPSIQAVSAIRDQKHKLQHVLVEQMTISIGIVIAFAGMLFFGSILNSSLISLAERQQEIATFRVLGYTPLQVGTIFIRESLLVNLTGTLLGIPLGIFLGHLIVRLYDFELFRMPFVLTPESMAFTFLLGLTFTVTAHWPVQRTINRMNWLEALNVKE